jgi:SPP1 gp7 family putative phage head morphogenesis protein
MHANERVGRPAVELTKGSDPSSTHGLQRALLRDLQRRLREVRGAIRRTVGYENDALELSGNADATEAYDFPTEENRFRAFLRDLRGWLREALVGDGTSEVQVRNGNHWLSEYVREAYQVGIDTGQSRLLQAGVNVTSDDPEDMLRRPISQRQLADLYSRSFENLMAVTEDAAQSLRERLTAGLSEGKNPRKLASDLNKELQTIERSRLATIARTEIINSHSEAALNTYEQHGTDVVGHAARLTAKDTSVCAFCRALDGIPFTLSEFQSVTVQWGSQTRRVGVPAHPNGRCSPVPEIGLSEDDLAPLRERLPASAGGRRITILST